MSKGTADCTNNETKRQNSNRAYTEEMIVWVWGGDSSVTVSVVTTGGVRIKEEMITVKGEPRWRQKEVTLHPVHLSCTTDWNATRGISFFVSLLYYYIQMTDMI